MQSPLVKKGDLSVSFSPVLSNFLYINAGISYSPFKKVGFGLSTVNNNFYQKHTASIGFYSPLLTPHPDKKYLYKGFLTETWLHYSKGKLNEGNTDEYSIFGGFEDSFDAQFKAYKIDVGFNYFYNYVQLTFRPKLTFVDINKIISRTSNIAPSITELISNDPYVFLESTFKLSIGTTRSGVFLGSNLLFGNGSTYFERLNLFIGGRITISDYL